LFSAPHGESEAINPADFLNAAPEFLPRVDYRPMPTGTIYKPVHANGETGKVPDEIADMRAMIRP
jgi:hypothetical protein